MNGEFTQANFNKLPALVARQVFLDWSGLSSKELTKEVEEKRVTAYQPKGHKRAKYYKHELAALTRFKL